MESEHRGRDYFAPKRGSTTAEQEGESQQTGEPQHVRPPFGMSSTGMNSHMGSYFHLSKLRRRSASTEDIRVNPLSRGDDTSRRSSVHGVPPANHHDSNGSGGPSSAAATPARVETPGGGPRTRRARFKAMSLPPISRRPSVDEHQPPFSTAGVGNGARVDGFVLGPPIEGIEEVSVGAAAGSTRESSTPPPPRESPHMLNIQIPGPSVPANPVSSPRRAHHPQLSIALPPPTFAPPPGTKAAARTHDAPITTTTDMPPPMFQQRLYQAQAPPTPLGWDAPWRERDQGMFGRPRGAKAHQHSHHHHHRGQRDSGFAVEDPWLQPFEETAYEDTSEASREESPRSPCVGRTRRQRGAVGSDSSGPLFTLSEKSGGRRQTSGRGRTERALTKWAALRRSAVKNPPGTRRTKIREYLMYDARSTLYLRLLTLVGIATSLGIGCKLFLLEQESDLDGILGSAPILSISYGSVSSIHCLLIMYREAFGKPIGLWGLRSKMTWVCLDLFFIALWYVRWFPRLVSANPLPRSSDLSLTISDYMSSPLQCAKNPWWTSNDYIIPLPEVITRSSQKDDMCNRQAALIAFVLVTLIMYVVNIIISLFRIFERLSTVAKSYEQSRVGQLV